MSAQPINKTAGGNVLSALDLPHELHLLQNAYWEAQHEWQRLDEAYQIVVADLLERRKAIDKDAAPVAGRGPEAATLLVEPRVENGGASPVGNDGDTGAAT